MLSSALAQNSALLYPQFQLLLCFTAVESLVARAKSLGNSKFATKKFDPENKPLDQVLGDLIRDLGIDRSVNKPMDGDMMLDSLNSPSRSLPQGRGGGDNLSRAGSTISIPGTVVLPTQQRPENLYVLCSMFFLSLRVCDVSVSLIHPPIAYCSLLAIL